MGQVILLDGPTGAGKSTCLDFVRDQYAEAIKVGRKLTTRRPRATDNDWEFSFVDRMEADSELLVFGSVTNQYGVNCREIDTALRAGRSYCITCTDPKTIAELKQRYPTSLIYIFRPLSELDLASLARERGTTDATELDARRAELKSQLVDYVGRVALVDRVVLNLGGLESLIDQLRLALDKYCG